MSDEITVIEDEADLELQARTKAKPLSRQVEVPELWRVLPLYAQPQYSTAQGWRATVRGQPILTICQGVLLDQLVTLPWKLSTTNPEEAVSRQDELEYHTDLINEANGEDYDTFIDRAAQDTLTIPFGGAVEALRYRDGSLYQLRNIDGGTLFPTTDPENPVAQRLPETPDRLTIFPKNLIARAYISPRPEYTRKGWGMAPPEKIFLAAMMLAQGDTYYWKLLVDTPEAGILDLGDMKKETALTWVNSFRDLMSGINPLKIPVLYEHEKPAQFLPFGRSPVEIQMREAVLWYAAIASAGYGVPLSEIGLKLDETLAGAIRSDRRARRTGFGKLVQKMTNMINSLLPKGIKFEYVDRDEEALANLGRARTTNMTAMRQGLESKPAFLTVEEARAQLRADGIMDSIVLTTTPPTYEKPDAGDAVRKDQKNDERVKPSDEGGEGVVRQETRVKSLVDDALKALLPVYRKAHRDYTAGEVVDFGFVLRSDILIAKEERSGLIPDEIVPEGEEERIALDLAAEMLSQPWARRTVERAWTPRLLRGTPLYNRLTGAVRGVVLL